MPSNVVLQLRGDPPGSRLTHVQLPDEAGHVVVLEELGEDLLGEALLVQDQEAVPLLKPPRQQNICSGGAGLKRHRGTEPDHEGPNPEDQTRVCDLDSP